MNLLKSPEDSRKAAAFCRGVVMRPEALLSPLARRGGVLHLLDRPDWTWTTLFASGANGCNSPLALRLALAEDSLVVCGCGSALEGDGLKSGPVCGATRASSTPSSQNIGRRPWQAANGFSRLSRDSSTGRADSHRRRSDLMRASFSAACWASSIASVHHAPFWNMPHTCED